MKWPLLLALAVSLSAVGRSADEPASAGAATAAAAEPKLEGVVIERSSGGFLTVTMDGPKLVLSFFDAEKKQIPPDVDHAFVRIHPAGRNPLRRTLIKMDDGLTLTHGQPLRPPWVFKLYITLVDANDKAIEEYVVDYP